MIRPILTALTALGLAAPLAAQEVTPDPADWDAVLEAAEGQTVYWHAWAGWNSTNEYIAWVGDTVSERYGVRIEHVKLNDTAEAVSRVIAEKSAGKDEGGAVDLIWINGENFAAMKEQGLFFGPWVEDLPNWQYIDPVGNPGTIVDFTVPTDGLEAPWSQSQVVFYYDTARVDAPPRSIRALGDWLRDNPGRFAYPQPPDFLGTTFLKQALMELAPDPAVLEKPVTEEAYAATTAPLWAYLNEITPNLWRGGAAYPQIGPRLIQLMNDGEIDLAISFNPNEASNAIASFELPDTVRTYVLDGGTISNISFVAIPYNASAKAGAMVVANFLMSPEAQARKADPVVWGSGTVLSMDRLDPEDRARFDAIERGIATLSAEELGTTIPQPPPSWMTRLEEDWTARYGVGQ
ncbi:ABC transporter substrate-binding protein [Roseovarius autotrophicus]|uniref:ABC transporter substrate-binding protein n=1 Tax=Roseovarius autotrophicus TaxID=2824121 RepID=UPI0019E91278|nr:ABC transporter substrate-binding protein [Roseovarius autotrophicus]MBE0453389.1 ABC transporter substrate-binding protein [Roseovarius sp.]